MPRPPSLELKSIPSTASPLQFPPLVPSASHTSLHIPYTHFSSSLSSVAIPTPFYPVRIQTNSFTASEWPVFNFEHATEFSIGREQGLSPILKALWSDDFDTTRFLRSGNVEKKTSRGLGVFRREVLLVLTGNGLASVFRDGGDPADEKGWIRAAVLNRLVDGFARDAGDELAGWKGEWMARSCIEDVAWGPKFEEDGRVRQYVAAQDSSGAIILIQLDGWTVSEDIAGRVVSVFPASHSQRPSIFEQMSAILTSGMRDEEKVRAVTVLKLSQPSKVGYRIQFVGDETVSWITTWKDGVLDIYELGTLDPALGKNSSMTAIEFPCREFLALSLPSGDGAKLTILACGRLFDPQDLRSGQVDWYDVLTTGTNWDFRNGLLTIPGDDEDFYLRSIAFMSDARSVTTRIFKSSETSLGWMAELIERANVSSDLLEQIDARRREFSNLYKLHGDVKVKVWSVGSLVMPVKNHEDEKSSFEVVHAACVSFHPANRLEYTVASKESSSIFFSTRESVKLSGKNIAMSNSLEVVEYNGNDRYEWPWRGKLEIVKSDLDAHRTYLDDLLVRTDVSASSGLVSAARRAVRYFEHGGINGEDLSRWQVLSQTTASLSGKKRKVNGSIENHDEEREQCPLTNCGAKLLWPGLFNARCESGHTFSACSLTFLIIGRPYISKYCEDCSREYLNEMKLSSLQRNGTADRFGSDDIYGEDVVKVLSSFAECVYCGGKFVSPG